MRHDQGMTIVYHPQLDWWVTYHELELVRKLLPRHSVAYVRKQILRMRRETADV